MTPSPLSSQPASPIVDPSASHTPASDITQAMGLREQDAWDVASLDDLPTMYDLPSEEVGDSGLPDEFHLRQAQLLESTFAPESYPIDQVFSAIDLNLYYDASHTSWYKRPDWFGAVGVPRMLSPGEMRMSYLIWREQAPPAIVVELLSPDTAKDDLGETIRDTSQPPVKWDVYERILAVPYYVVYGRMEAQPRLFRLANGRYEALSLVNDRHWLPELGLGIGLWHGSHHGADRPWLRWYGSDGNWIQTPEERADQERQNAAQERQNAAQERQRADRLAQMLRDLGVDPGD